ncbi:MAG TPA: hypothetical protein EYN08_02080 [Gammaproteobacteria bacterium]|nr:hypothetical protein [Gammaproteobacteria bacterium]
MSKNPQPPGHSSNKGVGTSNRILLVSYKPTQAVINHVNDAFPHQELLKNQKESDNTELGTNSFFTTKSTDLLRYHLRKYFRHFPASLKADFGRFNGPEFPWRVDFGGTSFFNPNAYDLGPSYDHTINYGSVLSEFDMSKVEAGGASTIAASKMSRHWPSAANQRPPAPEGWFLFNPPGRQEDPPSSVTLSRQTDTPVSSGALSNPKIDRGYAPFWTFLSGEIFAKDDNPAAKKQYMVIYYHSKAALIDDGEYSAKDDPVAIQQGGSIQFWNTGPNQPSHPEDPVGITNNFYFDKFIKGHSSEKDTVRINSLNLNSNAGPFYDFVVDYKTPISEKDSSGLVLISPLLFDIKENYNFYLKSYEKSLSDLAIHMEPLIPNINILMDVNASELPIGEVDSNIKDLITLGGLNGNYANAPKQLQYLLNSSDQGKVDIKSYLYSWSTAMIVNKDDFIKFFTATNFTSKILKLYNRSKNIVIPPWKISDLVEYSKKKDLFPMNIQIDFDSDKTTDFSDALYETGLWKPLIEQVINIQEGTPLENIEEEDLEFRGYQTSKHTFTEQDSFSITSAIPEIEHFKTKAFNFKDWMDSIDSGAEASTARPNYILLDAKGTENINSNSKFDYDFLMKKITFLAFKSKFNSLLSKHSRTYLDMLMGKKSYNETIFYRVAKINKLSGETVQNFYFVNSSEAERIRYTDTQIEYGQEYEYKIYSWNLVIGLKYDYETPYVVDNKEQDNTAKNHWFFKYSGNFSHDWGEHAARLEVNYETVVRMMEVPYYFSDTISVMDNPPIFPNVDLIPYKDRSDSILIALSSQTGEMKAKPISFSSLEENRIKRLREAKKYPEGGEILFKTDDFIDSYEIFRMDREPKSYEDFIPFKMAKLKGRTTFVDDTLAPNKKYYYMFRAVDVHTHFSNPSPIYELEMVKDLEAFYPVIKLFDMDAAIEKKALRAKKTTKVMKKYMQIKPTNMQTQINFEDQDVEDTETAALLEPSLGLEDSSLFGKKFKIRLTSRKTGRRVDFNVDFTKSYDNTTKTKIT